jgi:hypothetical protein
MSHLERSRDRAAEDSIRRWMDGMAPDRAPERAISQTIHRLRETRPPRMFVLRLPLPAAAAIALVAALLIGALTWRAGLIPLQPGDAPEPSTLVSAGPCVLEQVAGGRQVFYTGRGFSPDTDVELRILRANAQLLILGPAQISSLHTDEQGRFGVQLMVYSEDIGRGNIAATAGCTASVDFVVTAEQVGPPCIAATTPQELMDTAAYRDAISRSDPLAWWHLDEQAGQLAADSAGDSDGTWQGTVQAIIGSGGTGAAYLPGDGGSYIAVPQLTLGDFTVEAWVLLCDYADNQDVIVGHGSEPPDMNFFEARLRLFVGEDEGDDVVTASSVAQLGVWQHWAVTRDATATRIFHGGVLDATGAIWDGEMIVTQLGRGNAGSLRGALDEVAIYDRALDADELLAHVAAR